METGGTIQGESFAEQERYIMHTLEQLTKRMRLRWSVLTTGAQTMEPSPHYENLDIAEGKVLTQHLIHEGNSLMHYALSELQQPQTGLARIFAHRTLEARLERDRGFDRLEWEYYSGPKSTSTLEHLEVTLNSQFTAHKQPPLLSAELYTLREVPTSQHARYFCVLQGTSPHVVATRTTETGPVTRYEPAQEHPEEVAAFLGMARRFVRLEW